MSVADGNLPDHEIRGTGETVVFVHGLGSTASAWEAQVRHLAGGFRTLRYDMAGAGRTPARGAVSVDGWVDELAGLMDATGVARAKIVGHSLGTLVAQHFAVRFPERVAGLMLLGVNRGPNEARRKALADRAAKVRAEGIGAVVDAVVNGTLAPQTLAARPEIAGFVRELMLTQSLDGYVASLEAAMNGTPPDAAKLACPVVAVYGVEDKASPAAIAEGLVADAPKAELRAVEACGHWHPIEQVAAVNAILDDFLRG